MSQTHEISLFGRTVNFAIYDQNTLAAQGFAVQAQDARDVALAANPPVRRATYAAAIASGTPSNFTATATVNADGSVSFSSGIIFWDYKLTAAQIAAGEVTAYLPIRSGTVSATVTQRTASADISGTTENLAPENGALILRAIDLDATCTVIRCFATATGAAVAETGFAIALGEPAKTIEDATLLHLQGRRVGELDEVGDILSTVGGASGATVTGFDFTVAPNTYGYVELRTSQAMDKDEPVTVQCRVSPGPTISAPVVQPYDPIGAGGSQTFMYAIEPGLFQATLLPVGGSTDATFLRLDINNLGGANLLSITEVAVFNGDGPPATMKVPAVVRTALASSGASVAYVVDGADAGSANGSSAAPYPSIDAAVAAGWRVISIPADGNVYTHKKLTASGGRFELRTHLVESSGYTIGMAFGGRKLTSADFASVGGYTNLKRTALTTVHAPRALWMQDDATGELTLLGTVRTQAEAPGNHRPYAQKSLSLAAAEAASAGAWAIDSGFLYVNGVASGKTYLVGDEQYAVQVDAGGVYLSSVRNMGGADGCIRTNGGQVNFVGRAEIGWSGYSALDAQDSVITFDDLYSAYAGDGQDAMQCDRNTVIVGRRFHAFKPSGDGLSPHFFNVDVRIDHVEFEDCGKHGFVPVGVKSRFRFGTIHERGSFGQAIYVLPVTSEAYGEGDVSFHADEINAERPVFFDLAGGPANTKLTVKVGRLNGAPLVASARAGTSDPSDDQHCSVRIEHHEAHFRGANVVGIQCSDAALDWRGKITGSATHAILMTGGTARVAGNLLRNGTGIFQTGGTLTLSLSDPLNVFGNTTNFNGVSSGDQANTLSVQAI